MMMAAPYTIRIFVPEGDPDGLRLIDRMNWTGVGFVFPRQKWAEAKKRAEASRPGVYILVGYAHAEDELPTLYIGQGDDVRARIDLHASQKDFWTWAVVFSSSNGGLNRAHVTWLEHALVKAAKAANRCKLDNVNAPQEPGLSEAEKADTQGFLQEVLQILPLVGLKAFEKPEPVAVLPDTNVSKTAKPANELDTVIVPARQEGFEQVFLGEHQWYAIRIGGGMLSKIRHIAAYQSAPVSGITHVADVARIEPYGEEGKYRLIFKAPARQIGKIPFGPALTGAMQGPRYTTLAQLLSAKSVADLV